MTASKKVYDTITGSEKERFIKDMGILEYDKLVSHLRKVLGIESPGTKDGNTSVLHDKKVARESET